MKKDIHPKYFEMQKSAALAELLLKSDQLLINMEVEIVLSAHPFYTGKERSSTR
jgi:ribosomal protein L31